MWITRIDARSRVRGESGLATMLGTGDLVDTRVRRQHGVSLSAGVGMQQRSAFLPVFGRSVYLDEQLIETVLPKQSPTLAAQGIGCERS